MLPTLFKNPPQLTPNIKARHRAAALMLRDRSAR